MNKWSLLSSNPSSDCKLNTSIKNSPKLSCTNRALDKRYLVRRGQIHWQGISWPQEANPPTPSTHAGHLGPAQESLALPLPEVPKPRGPPPTPPAWLPPWPPQCKGSLPTLPHYPPREAALKEPAQDSTALMHLPVSAPLSFSG